MAPTSTDPAILRSLSISSSTTKIAGHGGSGFASTYRLTTPKTSIFVKTSSGGEDARIMFEGEYASLNAINDAVPSLCPRALAHGPLENGNGGYFLATEFLDLKGSFGKSHGAERANGSDKSLAEKLATLHTTPAPVPAGFEVAQFGFPVTTCCGDTPQDNQYSSSWAEFFGRRRLLAILERSEQGNGKDPELRKIVERTISEVVPRLLGDRHLGGGKGVLPVVVHGDLWSGNKGHGSFVGRNDADSPEAAGGLEEVVFDPSSCYAHSEYDLGIMKMFGGFSSAFFKEYHNMVPKTEPAEEYDDRVDLYQSFHHLNHFAIFGGGYRSGATTILKRLIKRYGSND